MGTSTSVDAFGGLIASRARFRCIWRLCAPQVAVLSAYVDTNECAWEVNEAQTAWVVEPYRCRRSLLSHRGGCFFT